MTFWHAVTYRLFASGGRPGASLWRRGCLFAAGVGVTAVLVYRITPHLIAIYSTGQVVMVVWAAMIAIGMLAGLLTDSYQRAFLDKLYVLAPLPLTARRKVLASVYALLPVNIIVSCITTSACISLFGAHVAWYMLAGIATMGCVLAITGDVALRLSDVPRVVTLTMRVALLIAALSVARMALRLYGVSGLQQCLGIFIGSMAVYGSLLGWLLCRPMATNRAERMIMPVIEGRLSVVSALPVRALRTVRYMSTNVVLLAAVVLVIFVARAAQPPLPLDSAVFIMFLLAGTLGQEARTLSSTQYPLELSLYGALRQWLAATWSLAFVHGLLWIDICLTIVRIWSPHGLSIGYVQAGATGMCFIAAGIAAGSIIVPQKYDILAQCASTVVYGLLVWLIVKGFDAPFGIYTPVAIYTAVVVTGCLMTAGLLEYWRWHKTIRRKICITQRSRQ
jgi:hypothetical protein